MGSSNVTNLRPRGTRPYDRTEEDGAPVVLSELCRTSPVEGVRDAADSIVAQVRTHQSRRLHSSRRR